jgi:hypothetical protein
MLKQQVQQDRALIEQYAVEQIGLSFGQLRIDETAIDERERTPVDAAGDGRRHEAPQKPTSVLQISERTADEFVMGRGHR